MELLQRILNSGVDENYEDFLNQKIRITNSIALFFLGVIFFNSLINLFTMPSMIWMMLPAVPLWCLVIFLNKWNSPTVSRYTVTMITSILCYFIHNLVIKEGEKGMTSMYMVQLCLLLLPWILFDYREKVNLFTSFGIMAVFIFLVEPTNALIEPDPSLDLASMKEDSMENVSKITSIIIMAALLYILQRFNMQSEVKNQKLLVEADRKNMQLRESEEKMNLYIKEVEASREEDKKREWSSKGLALFAEILRSNEENSESIYDKIISNIVKYLGANQGALFVMEKIDEQDVIELKACFAYDRKKFIDKVIQVGEGLVGQCVYEKEYIYLKDVPSDFVKITSGTGAALPKEVILVPLMINEKVYGVIELASFSRFEKYQIEFLKKVGESISSSIYNFKISRDTRLILEQSMQQSEELRSQEEEMRQTLEEMNAIQEEMTNKQQHMQETIEALSDRNAFLEEKEREYQNRLEQALSELSVLKSA
jgi:hypothetical protein